MKLINPLNQNHWCIVVLAVLKLMADRDDEPVQIKHHILGRQTCKDCVLDLLIHLHGEPLNILNRAADEIDRARENSVEELVFQNFFSVILDYIVDGIASC